MTFARVFTGLDRQAARSNVEEVRSNNGKTLGALTGPPGPPGPPGPCQPPTAIQLSMLYLHQWTDWHVHIAQA